MAQDAVLARHDTLDCLEIRDGEQGRGLFVRKAAKKGEALLIVPFSTLLHVGTADRYLPKEVVPRPQRPSHESHWKAKRQDADTVKTWTTCPLPLTSVQALTLILARWHASQRHTSTNVDADCSSLNEFLRSYPREYKSMPLQWQLFVESVERAEEASGFDVALSRCFKQVLEHLPPGVAGLTEDVHRRYRRDRDTLKLLLEQRTDLFRHTSASNAIVNEQDISWAWSSVNTRCVYLPLGLKPHGDNFTLAPLLDMANHTFDERQECKVEWLRAKALQLAAAKGGLQAGDQVFISYGPHSNGFLLAEYGFMMPFAARVESTEWPGNPFCEIQVDRIVDQLVDSQGKDGQAKKALLSDHGYWHDYTIHPHPGSVHPSYRLVVALRLLSIPSADKAQIHRWTALVQGQGQGLGKANDEAVLSSLRDICNTVVKSALDANESIKRTIQEHDLGQDPNIDDEIAIHANDLLAAVKNVSQLHEEEVAIANLMLKAIDEETIDWL